MLSSDWRAKYAVIRLKGLLFALVWGEFQNFNTRNDIIPPIAADNKHIQISLDTHIFTAVSPFCCVRVRNWRSAIGWFQLPGQSAPSTPTLRESTRCTRRITTRITAKFSIRRNFPTVLYYLNTTRSLDIKRRLRQISYHQTKGQIVISNTNTGGITRVYRDEKLLGFACLLHLGCAF